MEEVLQPVSDEELDDDSSSEETVFSEVVFLFVDTRAVVAVPFLTDEESLSGAGTSAVVGKLLGVFSSASEASLPSELEIEGDAPEEKETADEETSNWL